MANFTPRKIMGEWKEGYALDLHTVSSTFIGHDESGHARFDNTYSDVGQLLYNLKSNSDMTSITKIVSAVEAWMAKWNLGIDVLLSLWG